MLHFILILICASNIKGVTVDIDGKIDLGPKWKYEYKIQPEEPAKHIRAERKHIFDVAAAAGSELIDMIKKQFVGGKSNDNRTVTEEPKVETENVTKKSKKTRLKEKPIKKKSRFTDESTKESDSSDIVKKKVQLTDESIEESDLSKKVKKKKHPKDGNAEESHYSETVKKKDQYKDKSTEESNLSKKKNQLKDEISKEISSLIFHPSEKVKKKNPLRHGSIEENYLSETVKKKSKHKDESTEESDHGETVKKKSQLKYGQTEEHHLNETVKKKSQRKDESTEESDVSETVEEKNPLRHGSTEENDLSEKVKKKSKHKGVSHKKSDPKKRRHTEKSEDSIQEKKKKKRDKQEKTETQKNLTTTTIIPIVPRNNDMFVKPVRVKDDATLTSHIQHIYKQSLKVFEDLKNMVDNSKLKKEINFLSRSYDEKFKEFVKENKYHIVKSRLGRKKVLLNAAETSNKILDRLIGYLKSKVETTGLRSNVPNVLEKELNKKIDLENKRMCKKFGLCRSGNGFRHFMIEAFTTILNSDSAKIKQATDAMTEVLKNRDFSRIMDSPTEKQFLRGIRDFENYSVDILKPIYFIMRNILVNINEPLKVTNRDRTVNKTVAFIEFIDLFDDKMLPNEENKLAWDDMLSTLRSWSSNQRYDLMDIVEAFVDQVMKAIDGFDIDTTYQVEKNFKLLIN